MMTYSNGESRQNITADCDVVHFVSHTGDDHMEDCNKVAEEIGGMSDSGSLKVSGRHSLSLNSKGC
jgi:hypothetical protein